MRILVVVASRHGTTDGIGDRLAQRLARHGHEVRRAHPDEVDDLTDTDAVVVGSSVQVGRWHRPARRMVRRLGDELRGRPVWLFSSGPLGDPPVPSEDPPEVIDLIERTGARDHRVFPGALDRSGLRWYERAVVDRVGAPEGDWRDLAEVDAWADTIDLTLRAPRPGPP